MAAEGTENRYRLCLNRCRNRWCQPCANEKRRIVQENVRNSCAGRELRFLTLTLRSTNANLSEELTRLSKCFRLLRQRREMRGIMQGGIYFVEVTRNAQNGHWHPHLHILFEGQYQHKSVWSRLWLSVTGDSYIIDIRRVNDSSQAAGYISKYAGKPVSAKITRDSAAFTELISAISGRKTFHTFGSWRNLGLSEQHKDDTIWNPVMPLGECILNARNGNQRCQAILTSLRRGTCDVPVDDESDTT